MISVRVPRWLKEEAERLGVDLRRTVEEALRRAVLEEKKRRLAEALERLEEAAPGLGEEDWVRAVRSTREARAP